MSKLDFMYTEMSEECSMFLTHTEKQSSNYLTGIREGQNKFLSNLYLKLVKKHFDIKNNKFKNWKYNCSHYFSNNALKNRMENRNFVFEHIVPKSLIQFVKTENRSIEEVQNLLFDVISKYWLIATITEKEDAFIRTSLKKLENKTILSDLSTFTLDPFFRYTYAEIKLLKNPIFSEERIPDYL